MQVYGPPQNKLTALKANNPTYWSLLLSRSEYSEDEVNQALVNISQTNDRLQGFLSSAYDLIEGQDWLTGFDSEVHQKLSNMLSDVSYLSPHFSENSHLNCFPVRKWKAETDKLNRQIDRLDKFVKSHF